MTTVNLPQPAPAHKLGSQGRSVDFVNNNAGRSTHAGWANFRSDEQAALQADMTAYRNSQNYQEAQRRKQANDAQTQKYNVYVDQGYRGIDFYQVSIGPDGFKSRRLVQGGTPTSESSRALAAKSLLEYPQDHAEILSGKKEPEQSASYQAQVQAHSKFQKLMPGASTSQKQQSAPAIAVIDSDVPPPAEEGLFEQDVATPIKVKVPQIPQVKLPGSARNVTLPPRSPGFDGSFSAPTQPKAFGRQAAPKHMRVEDLRNKYAGKHSNAITANSKPVWDDSNATARTKGRTAMPTVVVPQPFKVDTSPSPLSKPSADDAELYEQPGFGSKPTVRVPTQPHKNHQFGYAHEAQMRAARRLIYPVAQSVFVNEAYLFPAEKGDQGTTKVTVGVMEKPKKHVYVHMKRSGNGGYRKHDGGGPRKPFAPRQGSNTGPAGPSQRNGAPSAPRNNTNKPQRTGPPPKPRGWNPKPTTAAGTVNN